MFFYELCLFYLHGKLNSFFLHIYAQHLHIHDVPNADHFQRMPDIFIGHLRNVYQAVLMDADVHKGSEINNVSHSSLQNHALC